LPVLGARERYFIDSTINTRKYQRDTFKGTLHEGSSLYLYPESPRDLGNPDWI